MLVVMVVCAALNADEQPVQTIANSGAGNEVTQTGGMQSGDFWEQFDDLPPANLPATRSLPRYIGWIETPAAFVLINAFHAWDVLVVRCQMIWAMAVMMCLQMQMRTRKALHCIGQKCTWHKQNNRPKKHE